MKYIMNGNEYFSPYDAGIEAGLLKDSKVSHNLTSSDDLHDFELGKEETRAGGYKQYHKQYKSIV